MPNRNGRPEQNDPVAAIPPWVEALVKLLDRALLIPGTKIPIGLDAILGFIAPGAGDAASGIASGALIWIGFKMRAPRVILLRMFLNVAIDALLGSVPLLGDVFDLMYRASDKNLVLLKRTITDPRRRRAPGDYLVLAACLLGLLFLLALPIATGVVMIHLLTGLGSG